MRDLQLGLRAARRKCQACCWSDLAAYHGAGARRKSLGNPKSLEARGHVGQPACSARYSVLAAKCAAIEPPINSGLDLNTRTTVFGACWPHFRRVTGTQPHAIGPPHCGHWWKTVSAATQPVTCRLPRTHCSLSGSPKDNLPVPRIGPAGEPIKARNSRQVRFPGRRAAEAYGRRARRASTSDSPRLFERSERNANAMNSAARQTTRQTTHPLA